MRLTISILVTLLLSIQASAHILNELPSQSQVLKGYELDSVKLRMKQSPLHDIEGVWQFIDNGTTIAIERFDPQNIPGQQTYVYRIVIIKSPRLSLENGTVMGYITNTAKRNCYECALYTDGGLNGILSRPQTFTLNLTDNSSPEEIKARLNMSKKLFKRSLGVLMSHNRVVCTDTDIKVKE